MNILDAIKDRRSINFFDPDRTVSDELINEVISLANLAPSSLNLQPWEVVVVNDPERKAVLRKCSYDQPKVTEASATLIIIANPNAIEENVDRMVKSWVDLGYMKPEAAESTRAMAFNAHGDKDSINRKLFAVKNTTLFAMNLMLAAKGLGLETHPMDGFSPDKIKAEFNIPEDRLIPLLITAGYLKPGFKLLPRAWRRDLKEFVKFNNYK
jgi:nitroreductase